MSLSASVPIPTATTDQYLPHSSTGNGGHPLDPLTSDEITAVSLSVRRYIVAHTDIKAIKFVTAFLIPPPKRHVLAHLGIPIKSGEEPEPTIPIVRKAEVDFIDVIKGDAYNAVLSLGNGEWTVATLDKLPEGTQPQNTEQELYACEDIIRADETVRKLAADVGVLPDHLRADGWSIGYDDRFPSSTRLQQAFLFARYSEQDNLYAHPLDFIPIVDVNAGKFIHIDFPPCYTQSASGAPQLSVQTTELPDLSVDSLSASNRDRTAPSSKPFNYLPELLATTQEDLKPRSDVKPLRISQPEGVSFSVKGNEVEWQKWKMHVGFSHREGIALSTITYNDNGEVRPVFYRLSLVEMVVPYGAPEYPHTRKFAFDVGEYGMGMEANELSLGCDCLGHVHYLPGAYVGHNGQAIIIKNAICIHEEDAGVLWKHQDYRPGGRTQTVRSRRLVVSMVSTVANYEYIWNYHFYQDGNIELEIRLTGILQVYSLKNGEPNPHGTTVAPNINAHYHQHLFSIRVDPMIDGLHNSVIETDILPLPNAPTGSPTNFAGNGFITNDTVIAHQAEGGRDYDHTTERRWRVVNPDGKHYSSGKHPGYSIGIKGSATPLMVRPDGWVGNRATFAKKAVWVVRDKEGGKGGRMWPAGRYVPQTKADPEDSIRGWVKGDESVENEDIVLFITVGVTHIPRPEDWPVMPVECVNLLFKPQHFFRMNPSIDVPGTQDPGSVPAFPASRDTTTQNEHQPCCTR